MHFINSPIIHLNMETNWNKIHYSIYRADYKLHLLCNKINPLMLLHKLPFQKRKYEKEGIIIEDELNRAFKRPDFGISSLRAGSLMNILVFMLCWGTENIIYAIWRIIPNDRLYSIIAFVILSLYINYRLLFRKDNYLNYFKKFDGMQMAERIRWSRITGIVVLSIFLYTIGSFILFATISPKSGF